MSYVDLVDDTISSLITSPGLSGISVVRVSGPRALSITREFCKFIPVQPESHKIYFGNFKSQAGEVIDEVLVSFFSKGRSFTGDETTEISTHGGFAVVNRVLAELLSAGCRSAERGEFSFRAFYNGKIDMVQAEGVLSLINSRSENAREVAIQQLKGRLSSSLQILENQLIQIMAQLEASIDFSTEDIEPYSMEQISAALTESLSSCHRLRGSFKKGRVISQGLNAVLAGPPNVGKSSLYNALLGQEKAIVTPIAGTTRDLLEGSYKDLGIPLSLVDSAGLRDTQDLVEKIGIQKTHQALADADVVFYVLDLTNLESADLRDISIYIDKTHFVFNKSDCIEDNQDITLRVQDFLSKNLDIQVNTLPIVTSTKNGQGIQKIKDVLDSLSLVDIDKDEALITQHRHFDHLNKCYDHLDKALQLLKSSESFDLMALEVQSGLREVFSLLGKEYDEQVLDQVFKQFCLGK